MVYVSLFSGNFFEIDGCEAGWTAAMWKAVANLSETWNLLDVHSLIVLTGVMADENWMTIRCPMSYIIHFEELHERNIPTSELVDYLRSSYSKRRTGGRNPSVHWKPAKYLWHLI